MAGRVKAGLWESILGSLPRTERVAAVVDCPAGFRRLILIVINLEHTVNNGGFSRPVPALERCRCGGGFGQGLSEILKRSIDHSSQRRCVIRT